MGCLINLSVTMLIVKNKNFILFIVLLIAAFIFSNYVGVKKFAIYPAGPDEALHLAQSLEFYNILKTEGAQGLRCWWHFGSRSYPPLFTFSAALWSIFFGTTKIASTMVNSLYLIVLMLSVYLFGKKKSNKEVGLLAITILSLYPFIFGIQKFFMLDFALTAMVSLCLTFLLYSDKFNNRKHSLFFGISLGLGMLTKFTFPVFVMAPFCYVLLSIFRKIKISQVINVFFSICIGFIISLIYFSSPIKFFKYWHPMYDEAARGYIPITTLETSWRTLAGLTFYLRSLFYQISPLFSLFFLIAVILWIKNKDKQSKIITLLWIIPPFIIFTIIFNKWARYITPILPAIALITAEGILQLNKKRLKLIIVSIFITLGVLQYFWISSGKTRYNHSTFMYDIANIDDLELDFQKTVNSLLPDYIFPKLGCKKNITIGVVDVLPGTMIGNALKYSKMQNDFDFNIVCFPQNYNNFFKQKRELDFLIVASIYINPWPNEEEIRSIFELEKLDIGVEKDYKKFNKKIIELNDAFKVKDLIKIPMSKKGDKNVYIFVFERTGSPKDVINILEEDVTTVFTYPDILEYKIFFDNPGCYSLKFNYIDNQYHPIALDLNQDPIVNLECIHISQSGIFNLRFNSEEMYVDSFELKKIKPLEKIQLNRENTILLFQSGELIILYKDQELTGGLHLYTSLSSSKNWQDSTDAVWSIDSKSNNSITLYGRWPYMPIAQTWNISLKENGLIYWEVYMDVNKDISIDEQHAKVMLVPSYLEWMTANENGNFPDNFMEDKWKTLWLGDINNNYVSVVGSDMLPSITFSQGCSTEKYYGCIENSNKLYKSRVLGFFKFNRGDRKFFKPGKYLYFKGTLKIGPHVNID